ncbi:hypothetical protein DOTSEDRAFT_68208 [Dothistroma septosporum NZE10]|uniref:Zn(2)-C6 fungal-type domain-containing protein n=1 Tax=Dothistroma septosporum (strain NZE10 / CBS 128990) TaxID=675120 RepID=N1Q277_DOTSN|nr:hypothetical protein DOTSEDRAFT_68208 [Dothistroma septosporum NZE10]
MASQKRGRACVACASIKIKCALGSDTSLQPPCERCLRLNKDCVLSTPRRQKDRVAELEAQVAALTRLLQAQGLQEPGVSEDGISTVTASPASQGGNVTKKRRFVCSSASSRASPIPPSDNQRKDEATWDPFKIDQTLSLEEQRLVLQRYLTEVVPIFPLVPLPGESSLELLKVQRRTLLQAVMYAGSTGILPIDKQEVIGKELFNHLSTSIFSGVEKNLELLQAMQVACLWYRAPRHHGHVAVYQLIQLAESVAVDIGIGGQPLTSPAIEVSAKCAEVESGDALRAWLVCYLLSSVMSLLMRRPCTVEWTKHHDESLLFLEYAPSSPASDRWLGQYFRAERLCATVAKEMELDNLSSSMDMSDPAMKRKSQSCRHHIIEWRILIPQALRTDQTLLFWDHVATAYMHEPVLHTPTNKQSFAAPFVAESLSFADIPSPELNQDHIIAVYELVTAVQAIIDIYVSLDITTLMALPGFLYTSRAAYANFILAKLYIAVTGIGNSFSSIIDSSLLQVEEYTQKLVSLGERVHAADCDSAAARILRASRRMLEWYRLYTDSLLPNLSTALAANQAVLPENWNLQLTDSAADFGLDTLFTEPLLDQSLASTFPYQI